MTFSQIIRWLEDIVTAVDNEVNFVLLAKYAIAGMEGHTPVHAVYAVQGVLSHVDEIFPDPATRGRIVLVLNAVKFALDLMPAGN